MPSAAKCAICCDTSDLTGVIVGEQQLFLCAAHAARLGSTPVASYEDMAALFAASGLDRRAGSERRRRARRVFPPRPEGRRHNRGRRTGDPKT